MREPDAVKYGAIFLKCGHARAGYAGVTLAKENISDVHN